MAYWAPIRNQFLPQNQNKMPLGAAIQAGSGLIGMVGQAIQSRINRKQSVENQQRTILANKQMAEYAYSKDLEMWNRQNQYNNPANQMQRLKDAGINPVLAYGKDIGGLTSGQMPKYNAPRIDYNAQPRNVVGVLSQFQDFTMKNAQIDNIKEQTKLTQEKSLTEAVSRLFKDAGIKGQEADSARKSILADFQQDMSKELLEQIKQRTLNLGADLEIKEKVKGLKDLETWFQEEYKKDWKENRIRPNDPVWIRQMGKIIDWFKDNTKGKDIWNMLLK